MPPTTIDLHVSDADRILARLLRLSAEDRSMRFSAGLVTDETIRHYAARIRFGHGRAMGQVSKLGQLMGLAHASALRTVNACALTAIDTPKTQE